MRTHRSRHPVKCAKAVKNCTSDARYRIRLKLCTLHRVVAIDGVHQSKHTRRNEIPSVNALWQTCSQTTRNELDQRRVMNKQPLASERVLIVMPLLPSLVNSETDGQSIHALQLCPRVTDPVYRLEPLFTDVGITLSCRNIAVTQQLLHRPQICPVVEQVRGKCVAKCVWVCGR